MATNISSSLISYSKITQEPAKFKFPLIIPLRFTNESINISYSEVAPLVVNSAINGNLISIVPLNSSLSSTANISGQLLFNSLLSCNVISNSTIAPTISNKQLLAPQVINPTANIISVETAIFKLVTNIIANTSIAISVNNNVNLDSDLSVYENIQGNLINLIESDLIQNSEIHLHQTWEFPLEFPLLINDKESITYNIESDLTSNSVMINNSITSLLSVDLESQSEINTNISCIYSEISTINSNTNISANINSQLKATSNIVSNTVISSTIINQLKEISNVVSNSAVQGSLLSLQQCISNLTSDSNISADIVDYLAIESDVITAVNILSSISQSSKVISNLNSNEVIADSNIDNSLKVISLLNSNTTIRSLSEQLFSETSNLESELVVNANLCKLIESSIESESIIEVLERIYFPLEFPLNFKNGLNNYVSMDPGLLDADSIIINSSIQSLMTSNMQSDVEISADITSKYSINENVNVNSSINSYIKQVSLLTSKTLGLNLTISNTTINNKLNLIGPVNANTVTNGLIKSEFLEQCNIDSYLDINADTYSLIESKIEADCSIKEREIFEFPLEFPLGFNGLFNDVSINIGVEVETVIEANVSSIITSNISGATDLNAKIRNNILIDSSIHVELKINDVITDVTQLSSNISIGSIVSVSITRTNKLTGNIISNSTLNAALKNNVGLVENFVSNSSINAKLSYLYFIVLKGTFIKNSEITEIFDINHSVNSIYTDCSDTVIHDSNILQIFNIKNIKEQTQFNINKALTVQPFSVNVNLSTVSDVLEMVIFNTQISSIEQFKKYEETQQFVNILIKTKF